MADASTAISLLRLSVSPRSATSRRVRCDIVQKRKRMVVADSSALIVLTMRATSDGSLANCENRLAVSMKKGAPGGWPISSL